MLRHILISLLFILVIVVIALIYAMPPVIGIPFVLLCLGLLWRKKREELAIMLASLLVMFACLEVGARMLADDIFYREHEKWALKAKYRANVYDKIHARFGDMIAMDPSLKRLAEPHEIAFVTDGDGFRNAHDYVNEPYVILGDSFIASVGNSQEDIVVSQLNAAMPGMFYSLGYPGAPKDYEYNALAFLEKKNPDAKFIWFIFEGNDLNPPGDKANAPQRPNMQAEWKNHINLRAIPFMATRVLTLFYKSAKSHRSESASSKVVTYPIGGQEVGFYVDYIQRLAAPKLELSILGTPEVLDKTVCVFFIPDKYRVYKPWINDGPAITEPPAGLATLTDYFSAHHIAVIDLTPLLQAKAKEILPQGKFVFWRDDTHWNKAGIHSIVEEVKRCVPHK